jgi:hypothetical protein
MKTFFLKLFVFSLPILGFVVFIETTLRNAPNDYSYKNQYLVDNAEDIEILIMGSSHSLYGINPEYLSVNSFNAAHVSQSIDYDYLLFRKFSENLSNLKTVVLPISYSTLFSRLGDGAENWRTSNYRIFYGIEEGAPALLSHLLLYGSKPYPLFKRSLSYSISKVFSATPYNGVSVSDLGFGLTYTNIKQANLIASGKLAARRHTKDVGKWEKQNTELLNRLIRDCKTLGVNLLIITTPTLSEYRNYLNENQVSRMNSILSNTVKKHSNVTYQSFMSDSRFTTNDFHDADHLNSAGAAKFTRILNVLLHDN